MTHEIIELMQKLKFTGMRTSFEGLLQAKNTTALSNDEFINLLLQAEWEDRENKNLPVCFKMQGSVIGPVWKK